MTPPDFDPGVHEQLGALNAKMDHVIADQQQARGDRKQQYQKQEDMQRQLDGMDRELKTVNKRLDSMEPITADIGKWRERFIGMRLLIVTVSAIFGGLVVTAGKWIAIKMASRHESGESVRLLRTYPEFRLV